MQKGGDVTYFANEQVTQSSTGWQAPIDDTWVDTTFTWVMSGVSTSGASVSIYGSADEGSTWFSLGSFFFSNTSNLSGVSFLLNKPTNALKVTLNISTPDTATMTFSVTGR